MGCLPDQRVRARSLLCWAHRAGCGFQTAKFIFTLIEMNLMFSSTPPTLLHQKPKSENQIDHTRSDDVIHIHSELSIKCGILFDFQSIFIGPFAPLTVRNGVAAFVSESGGHLIPSYTSPLSSVLRHIDLGSKFSDRTSKNRAPSIVLRIVFLFYSRCGWAWMSLRKSSEYKCGRSRWSGKWHEKHSLSTKQTDVSFAFMCGR